MYFCNKGYKKENNNKKLNQKKVIYSQYNSLQAQGCNKNTRTNIIKSTFLSVLKNQFLEYKNTFNKLNGSLTVEAAFVLPIFLIFIFVIIYFMVIINFMGIVQSNEYKVSKKLSREAYILQKVEENGGSVPTKGILDSYLVKNGLSIGYIKGKICDKKFRDYSDKITNYKSININKSSISESNRFIDIKLDYKINIPYIERISSSIKLSNRTYFHTWVGESINKKQQNIKVYITPTGTVYHTDRNCPYIKLSIIKVKSEQIPCLRNASGEKYSICEKCNKKSKICSDIVYITFYGNRYHTDLNCSEIKRDIQEIDLSEVGDRTKCKKCGN